MKIKYDLFFFGIITLAYSACSPANKQADQAIISDNLQQIPHDAFVIDKPCIIFLYPDSLEIEQMKAKDSNDFYTGADDHSFYNSELTRLADSLKISNVSTDKKLLDFKTSDNKQIVIDLSKMKQDEICWGTYLFNGTDTPKLNSSIDIDKVLLQKFFKK